MELELAITNAQERIYEIMNEKWRDPGNYRIDLEGGWTLEHLGRGLYRTVFSVVQNPKYVVKFSRSKSDESSTKACYNANKTEHEAWIDFEDAGLGHLVAKVYRFLDLEPGMRCALIARNAGVTLNADWHAQGLDVESVNEDGHTVDVLADILAERFIDTVSGYAPELLNKYKLNDLHEENMTPDGVIIDYAGY